MKFLKVFILTIILLMANGCSFATIMSDDKPTELRNVSQKNNFFEVKTLPNRYTLSPLTDVDIQADAAMLMNAATGEILFEKNIDQSLAIASMSKIMSELLILEAIEHSSLTWDEIVPISDYALLISNYPGYASVKLQQDKDYTVRELFNAMAIRSANGATIALAEALAGSEKEFVNRMNEKAKQLGLDQSNFVNSTGLTNVDLHNHHSVGDINDSNMMSARDLGILAQSIINQFPELIEITKIKELSFLDQSYQNSNWMLPGMEVDWINEDVTFQGVDGLKTGFTSEAGYGFTGTVQMKDRRFISVIIGTEEIGDRFLETIVLYEAILEQLEEKLP